jgi:hypothetical protein
LKNKIILFSIFLLSVLANAQSWQPVGAGVNGSVNTLFVYDSVMYVGGSFTSPGNNIAQWNGSNWDSLSSGTNGEVYSFGRYNGLIYVGGWFSKAGGYSAGSIATWNGKSFANAGFDVEGGKNDPGMVDAICQYDSLLYIGGQFDSVDHKLPSGLVIWNGKKTDTLNTSYGAYWENVSILTTYKNLLLLGYAPIISGIPIGLWNNKMYNNNTDFFYTYKNYADVYMNAFCVFDSNLYLGGNFLYYNLYFNSKKDTIVNNIAMWNGHKWSPLGKGVNGTIYALASYNNMLIAGGDFDSAGGVPVNNIAAWNGTSWSAFGNGFNGPIYTLAVFDSNLYAGGDFSSPGNGIVEYISSPGVPLINNDSVNVFPNPNTGTFTVVCNRVITGASQPVIEIYNILGEKIYSANLLDGNTIIGLGKQAPGIYIYKISTADGTLINPGKLVIE